MGTPQGRWVLLATVLGSSLAMLDATVVNVALERIGAEFGAGFTGLQWTVNAYTLTLASLILMGGSLGDRFGRRRVFVVGTVWFAAASLLCGLAPDVNTLVAARAAFIVVQRRSPAPLVPPVLFASRQFTAANAVTALVYAPLGVVFVLLVLHLQVVAGFDPLPAGTALLPVTALMLAFSARVGALAQRIGPRPLLTAGPLIAAAGVLLMARIGPDAGYLTDVLAATAVFGAGLTLLVAPLTATVLDSAPDRLAGAASGVNNAVARAAGLLAGALVAAVLVRRPLGTPEPGPQRRLPIEECLHCGVTGPQVHPAAMGEGT